MGKKPAASRTRKPDTPGHIVATALELAATQGWRRTTLADIAGAAGLTLAELHELFSSRGDILAAFSAGIDAEALAGDEAELAGQPPRDRLFEVLMRRFEALGPHREAVRSIVCATLCDPAAAIAGAGSLAGSMAWTLEAAGIDPGGLAGRARVKGLAAVYLAVLRVWLADDSDDMARTMAALDRRLRQAERLVLFCRLSRTRPPEPEPEAA